ncbi:MAG: AMP-binding protein [Alphaproteobacteria bacterium]|jgi:long-chain acyl-CoA synthetase|nr:AMP-binding protein [Alphaproteobacteria bacterium]MDP6621968.1 AMP-binding protein [Alphaproteobacteria bacterium]|tara:strand:+ start:307 stop:2208 length:1902 start_codon:yes stop_codon:yes gene_type:complete
MEPKAAAVERYRDLRGQTAPSILARRASQTPEGVAYRAKRLGIYHERSWRQFRDFVAAAAAGLQTLGITAGDRVAIMGDACEEWAICDLGAQALGAITYGIYPTASMSEVAYQMRDGGARVFIAEDQEYVDKILPLMDELPGLEWIVVVDTTAMFMYDDQRIRSYDELLRLAPSSPEGFDALLAELDPAAPAFIVYTSGTTGDPKGALVSHGKHLAATQTFVEHYPQLRQTGHRTVAYLPLCHIMGRDITITLPLLADIVPHYGEEIEELPLTLFEVAPTLLMTVPRYLQKFASQLLVGIENTSPLKRRIYDFAVQHARRHARQRWEGGLGPGGRWFNRLLHQLAFRPILNKIGFDQLDLVLSGGAPLPPETMALWQVYGVNVVEIYGQTETGGAIISGQDAHFPRPGDIGTIANGWQVELAETGEILVRGEDMFEGYWQKPEATSQLYDAEGRLQTGDIGAWREGRLQIIDRARDFMITSGGKSLSPTHIENTLRASPYVSETVVFGDNRKYISALIEIDFDTVSNWARNRNLAYAGFTSLTETEEVRQLIAAEIERVNVDLARVEQVKAFRILPKVLDPEEEGEPVTPTRKVKRNLMYETFSALVESMYSDEEAGRLTAEIGDILEQRAPG